jgi:p-aminobenzoyl-glutamate transporter AbgT
MYNLITHVIIKPKIKTRQKQIMGEKRERKREKIENFNNRVLEWNLISRSCSESVFILARPMIIPHSSQ